MRALRLWSALGAVAVMLCAFANVSGSQERAHRGPPGIRIHSSSGTDVINTSTYVTPQIELSENAYVFSVAMDLDGQIQVLHPDFPGLSVKVSAHKQLHLPNFFAGFNQHSYDGYSGDFQHYTQGGWGDTRGVAIALASRAPFNLERIERGGDWDIAALRRLLENRAPEDAAYALASYIGAEGEPIGHDYMHFAGGQSNAYAYNDYSYNDYAYYTSPCDSYYGYYFVPGQGYALLRELNTSGRGRVGGQQAKVVGYDVCGVPIISFGPVAAQGHFPLPGQPRSTGDTTVFPKARMPRGTPRHPPQSSAMGSAEGAFPTNRSGLPQLGDVTITAPKGRRSEPGQILNGYGAQPVLMPAPEGRMPVDRSYGGGSVTAASGGQPLREARPEPRVESPPPSRSPEPRAAPAPVVHEHPAPPPPRVDPATTKAEPLRAPPQSRQ
ncbi:MAG: hypothetical protein ACJ79X_10205 [Gemmatimonadaceae bacterium]